MNPPIKLVIFGSCVSRDILDYSDHELELTEYFARSSFASAFHFSETEDRFSQELNSDFQRRVVGFDFSKCVQSKIKKKNFDRILVDLIDERFDLYRFSDGSICTISNELRDAGFFPELEGGRVIKSGSEEFFALWEAGWRKFVEIAKQGKFLGRVYINRVFWAHYTSDGEDFSDTYSEKRIKAANVSLARMYSIIGRTIPVNQILNFPPDLLVGDKRHKWGKSPFHYISAFYKNALIKILNLAEIPLSAELNCMSKK